MLTNFTAHPDYIWIHLFPACSLFHSHRWMTPWYCYTSADSCRCLVHTRWHLRGLCADRRKNGSWEETVHFQEDVYVHRKYSSTYVPTQVLWSLPSWKPARESHVHWKEPAVLTQLPRGSQPSLPITHSLMSEGKKRKKHSNFLSLQLISNPTIIFVFSSLPPSFSPFTPMRYLYSLLHSHSAENQYCSCSERFLCH